MTIAHSELIINPDGSIYHLNLKPHQLAATVITVGDLEHVKEVPTHYDAIDLKVGKREFITHSRVYNNKRITVISTGIATHDIEIIIYKLHVLVTFHF